MIFGMKYFLLIFGIICIGNALCSIVGCIIEMIIEKRKEKKDGKPNKEADKREK